LIDRAAPGWDKLRAVTADRPLSLRLYGFATRFAAPLALGLLRARARAGKEDAKRLGERLGRASVERPGGRLVWLHGVSVGESLSLLPLVEHLRDKRPDLALLVTSGTRASALLLAERLGEGVIHQYAPVDTPGAVARFLDHWRPSLGVFVESELWPNLILGAKARNVRLALISARLSERSLRGWRRAPAAARAALGAHDLLLARDEAAAMRFAALGVATQGLADLKFGAAPLPVDEMELAGLRAALGSRPIILAASTHPGEDGPIMDGFLAAAKAIAGSPLLIIAPRHPGRGPEIERLALAKGFPSGRRAANHDPAGLDVYVADTLGELGLWFRLAALAVIGGSFAQGVGGHNPLEPARLSCPFVTGPHVANWPVYGELERLGATRRVNAETLVGYIQDAVDGAEPISLMAAKARDFVRRRDADAQAVADRLLALVAA